MTKDIAPPHEFAYKMVFSLSGYVSPICRHRWVSGRNVSDRQETTITPWEAAMGMAEKGFHVFHTPLSAMSAFQGVTAHVLRVRVRAEHHIITGWFLSHPTSVYTEVENLGPFTGNA